MDRSVDSLWSSRARAFWRDSLPYIRYMAQSGLPGVTIMLLFAGLAGYASLLHHLPESFPYTLVGVVFLTPIVCWSPLRTWLREADIVFLVPREGQMDRYLRRSFRYNGLGGAAATAIFCAIYLPLYSHGPGKLQALQLLAAVLLLKLFNITGAWRERVLVSISARRSFRLLRWIVTAIGVASLLQTDVWKAVLYILVSVLLFALLYSRLPRYRFPWLMLIAEESRTRRRYNTFFSSFTDVPSESTPVVRRRYLNWLAGFIRYRNQHAFVYLYAHTLIRTELGGIVIRLLGLGVVSGMLAAESGLFLGWGAAAICLLFVWLTGIQLSSLAQAHRHSVWRHVYPLPDQSRLSALLKVDRVASLLSTAILWLPHAILLTVQGYMAQAVVAILSSLVYVLAIRPRRLKRLFSIDPDDED
ncbi:protein EcsB [Paenibacillus baekrokdamisoli]|uniref:Protein EcsB n=1 Tax=Paenibacillus baekrokdamisoli TaxID=1712516 RepID=A0A3G9JLC9_9BACL|nr:ABC transporter permease [Paenibacillus baekrokdamisoli]MBB3069450.1 ABC-2 type transport system permease protein [Paenibacillus baekrokdamisoli]BBH24978.1 protein EcsB [Paenibacillus baekrokdamisoli]